MPYTPVHQAEKKRRVSSDTKDGYWLRPVITGEFSPALHPAPGPWHHFKAWLTRTVRGDARWPADQAWKGFCKRKKKKKKKVGGVTHVFCIQTRVGVERMGGAFTSGLRVSLRDQRIKKQAWSEEIVCRVCSGCRHRCSSYEAWCHLR